MSNKLAKEKKNEGGINYLSWYAAVVATIALVLAIVAICVPTNGKDGAEEESVSNETDASVETSAIESPSSEFEIGEVYNGLFAEDLAMVGISVAKVENLEETTGVVYDGNIYTYESGWNNCTRIDGKFTMGDDTLLVTSAESFEVLLEKGFIEDIEDNGRLYYKLRSDEGEDLCVVYVGEDTATNYDGGERNVSIGYVYFKDASYCKGMAEMLRTGGVGVDSSIEDVVKYFGTPTYVDVYEGNGQAPYVMLYYSYLDKEDESMDELTIVFTANDNEDGYTLSEITTSLF